MTSCADLVDLLLRSKRKAARDYVEGSRAVKPALRPFMASLAGQENEQADALAELQRRGNLDLVFRPPVETPPSIPARATEAAPGAATELLTQVLRNTDAWLAALAFLEAHTADDGVAQTLHRLSEEARRTRMMVASRLDLESLGGT